MAPIDPSNTARLWLDYEVAGVEHTMMVRYNQAAISATACADWLASVLGWVAGQLPTSWVALGARVAAAGNDFSVPINILATDLGGFTGTNGASFPAVDHPRELTYVGRSTTSGRRTRISLYGFLTATPANYRYGPGENVFTAAEVFAALNAGSAAGAFVAIDGTPATWKPYANVQNNSYWETQRRTG